MRDNLIGHWKMDEEDLGFVDDSSGNELHGKVIDYSSGEELHGESKLAKVIGGKFTRGLHFAGKEDMVHIYHSPVLDFGKSSFSFSGWIKIEDYSYPMTSLAVRQGFRCHGYKSGITPGWDIGHGLQKDKTQICIRDEHGNVARTFIKHDGKNAHSKLKGKWTHYGLVFDRSVGKAHLYLNGEKQADYADISHVTGSINNKRYLTFAYMYGWMTKGSIDEYRLFKGALTDDHMRMVFKGYAM